MEMVQDRLLWHFKMDAFILYGEVFYVLLSVGRPMSRSESTS